MLQRPPRQPLTRQDMHQTHHGKTRPYPQPPNTPAIHPHPIPKIHANNRPICHRCNHPPNNTHTLPQPHPDWPRPPQDHRLANQINLIYTQAPENLPTNWQHQSTPHIHSNIPHTCVALQQNIPKPTHEVMHHTRAPHSHPGGTRAMPIL